MAAVSGGAGSNPQESTCNRASDREDRSDAPIAGIGVCTAGETSPSATKTKIALSAGRRSATSPSQASVRQLPAPEFQLRPVVRERQQRDLDLPAGCSRDASSTPQRAHLSVGIARRKSHRTTAPSSRVRPPECLKETQPRREARGSRFGSGHAIENVTTNGPVLFVGVSRHHAKSKRRHAMPVWDTHSSAMYVGASAAVGVSEAGEVHSPSGMHTPDSTAPRRIRCRYANHRHRARGSYVYGCRPVIGKRVELLRCGAPKAERRDPCVRWSRRRHRNPPSAAASASFDLAIRRTEGTARPKRGCKERRATHVVGSSYPNRCRRLL